MEFETFSLKNGIRVVHQQLFHTNIAHCGLLINVGSRDELPHEEGIAHFIEHCFFKGTGKRKAFHILNRLDAVGGEINAYTSKEETCIYASFLSQHLERAIELVADITFNSTFPEKEIEKEKDVIIDEINAYNDEPSEMIFDDFESLIFKNHTIGKNILGTETRVKQFTRDQVLSFIERNYTTDEIVFSCTAPIPSYELKKILNKHLSEIPSSKSTKKRIPFKGYEATSIEKQKETHQVHQLIGNIAYPAQHKKRKALILLNNLLGGSGLNTRLNLNVREKFGFTYYLESNYTPYSDTGIFSIYFGTDKKHLKKTNSLILKELRTLTTKKLGTVQLHAAKQQLIGQLALSQESKSALMLAYGKSLMLYNTLDTMEETYRKIELITAEEILDVAGQIFEPSCLSTLTFLSK